MEKDANVEEILQRIKLSKGFKEWKEVAQYLEINEKTLSAWRSRNSQSAVVKILYKCKREFSENYLLTGEGEPFPDPTHRAVDKWLSTEERGPSELSEHEREIAMERLVQVGKKRLGATDKQGIQEQDFSIDEMLSDTRTVLESDTVYRQALASNIRAFKQAVINEGKMKNTDEKIDQMMKQIEALTEIVLQGQAGTSEKKRAGNDH